jgi:hypothetical protein
LRDVFLNENDLAIFECVDHPRKERKIEDDRRASMTIQRTIVSIAKKILPRRAVEMLRQPVSFDNTYAWLNRTFSDLMEDPGCKQRPQYAWGVMQGAALAKVLRIPRISVVEFGVAGGFGLLTLERIAERIENVTNVAINVYGFDTGVGLPKPEDIRDQPNMWFEGQLPMDRRRLEAALTRASLHLGPVNETIASFIASNPAPVAFVSFDLDLYSSTRDALTLFETNCRHVLPRVTSYFDDIFGHTYNDFCGERLAIREFNERNDKRKVCPIYGLRYFISNGASCDLWPDGIYLAHFFEHPLYGALDSVKKGVVIDIDGSVLRSAPESDWRSRIKG